MPDPICTPDTAKPPVRKVSSGIKLSSALAGTAAASASALPSNKAFSRIAFSLFIPAASPPTLHCAPLAWAARAGEARIARIFAHSIRERPHPQFLLADLPQASEPVRLDDQKENNQRADDDVLQVLHRCGLQRQPDRRRNRADRDRQ